MLKLCSWNVNSLKVRLEQVLNWLASSEVDILAIQETKLIDSHFPENIFSELGYYTAFTGQKTYNGVAIISRYPISDVVMALPDYHDPQKRVLAATIAGIRIINLYVPNGSALNSDKYIYKLEWLEKINHFIAGQLTEYSNLAVVGDFNIAPADRDVHDPLEWQDCVLVSPKEREAFTNLLDLGLIDSFRYLNQDDQVFSWWDYRAGSFRRNRGLRIDHVLLSESLNLLCKFAQIDKDPRKWPRPSDHAPIWVQLDHNFQEIR